MKKKILSLVLLLAMCVTLLPTVTLTAQATDAVKPTTGDGTSESPYQITSAAELLWFANSVNSGSTTVCAKLTADIDLSGVTWTPIGGEERTRYTGTFDGNGYTISNLSITSDAGFVGLFGYIGPGGLVQNLSLTNVSVSGSGSSSRAGSICGYIYQGTIQNCCSTGAVSASSYRAGGICGEEGKSSVKNCYSTCTVSGSEAGGICGHGYKGGISNSYCTGNVSGSIAGGICGYSEQDVISNSYNTGAVTGSTTGGDLRQKRLKLWWSEHCEELLLS